MSLTEGKRARPAHPDGAGPAKARAEVAWVATRDEDDFRSALCQSLGNFEPTQIRQGNVQEYEVGDKLERELDGGLPAVGFSHDLVTLTFQQAPGRSPKGGVVVDDQHTGLHVQIVTH